MSWPGRWRRDGLVPGWDDDDDQIDIWLGVISDKLHGF